MVLLYACGDQGCPDELAQLEQLVSEQPQDPRCSGAVRHRLLVVADPELPAGVRFAAVAWGAYYSGTCLDLEALRAFIAERYAHAPEDLCGDGLALGGVPIP